ncbi:MAG: hypothetical protein IPH84_17935 [Bacteroidales bacterium]|nr:hypothetical protein [Bacteroidales bacterium]
MANRTGKRKELISQEKVKIPFCSFHNMYDEKSHSAASKEEKEVTVILQKKCQAGIILCLPKVLPLWL